MDDNLGQTTLWADPARLRVEVQALRDELRQANPNLVHDEVQGVKDAVTELRQEFVFERETRHHNDHNMMNVISTMKDALRQESVERQSRHTEFDNFMEMTTQIMHETQAHFRSEMQMVQETQANIKGWMEERQQGATQLSNAIKEVQKKLSQEVSERSNQSKAVEDVCRDFAAMRRETNTRLARMAGNPELLDDAAEQDPQTQRDLEVPRIYIAEASESGAKSQASDTDESRLKDHSKSRSLQVSISAPRRVSVTRSACSDNSELGSIPTSPYPPHSTRGNRDPWGDDKVRFALQSAQDFTPKDSGARFTDSDGSAGDSKEGKEDGKVNLLAALNSLKKSFDQEVHERIMNSARLERHLSSFQQLRNELQSTSSQIRQDASQQVQAAVAHTDYNIEEVKSEFKKQCDSTQELLRVINRLKECFDKEVGERILQTAKLERHIGTVEDLRKDWEKSSEQQRLKVSEEARVKIGETNRNLEDVKAECQRQRLTTEEMLRTINCLKSSLDKEQAESMTKHQQVLKSIEETQASLLRCNEESTAALASATAAAAAVPAAPAITTTHASERLKRMRAETARALSVQSATPRSFSEDLESNRLVELPLAPAATPAAAPAAAPAPAPVPASASASAGGGSARSELSDRCFDRISALQEQLAQSEKKVLYAVEREKAERTSSFGTLNSHFANFQYNLSAERNERSQLHSEVMELKASTIRQQRELQEKLEDVSASAIEAARGNVEPSQLRDVQASDRRREIEEQERRFQSLEMQVLQHSELITCGTGSAGFAAMLGEDKVSSYINSFGGNNSNSSVTQDLVEEMKTEVSRVFSEKQHSFVADIAAHLRTDADLYRSDSRLGLGSGSLDRLVREADLFKLEETVQRLEAIVIGQGGDFRKQVDNDGHKELKASSQQDNVTREEFESVTRHIWEAIGPESISRAEFDSHAHRLWDAIVQLQSRQLEDLRQDARDAVAGSFAFSDREMPYEAPSRHMLPPTAAPAMACIQPPPPPPPPMRTFQAPNASLGSSSPLERPPPLGLQNLGSGVLPLSSGNSGAASPTVMHTPHSVGGSASPRPGRPYEHRHPMQTVSPSPNPSPRSSVRSRAAPPQCGGDVFIPMSDALSPRGISPEVVTMMASPRHSGRIGYHVKTNATRTVSMQ